MKRFRTLSVEQCAELNVPGDDWQSYELWAPYTLSVVEFDLDTGMPIRIVGQDGAEPEDNTLARAWIWVAEELNNIAEEER